MTDPNLLSILQKLVPQKDGEPYTVHRTALVDAVNSDGTVDVELSGVVVPNVPVLERALVLVGDVVQVLAWQGALLVLGSVAVTDQRTPVREIFTSNGTWTKPEGAVACFIQVQGPGGGGGGAPTTGANQASAGGGGGAGCYAEVWADASALTGTVSVTVGSGGSGGSGGSSGSDGSGPSSFGGYVTANFGFGGASLAAGTSTTQLAGGGQGSGTTGGTLSGRLVGIGENGGRAFRIGGSPSLIIGETTKGGASTLGGTAPPGASSVGTNGVNGRNYGGGGSGGINMQSQATARTGGNGGNGVVIVTTYF